MGERMKRIVFDEDTEQSKAVFEKEQKRAIKELEISDNFVLVYHRQGEDEKGGGGCITCVGGKHMLPMAFMVHQISKELQDQCKDMIKKGLVSKFIDDLMKGEKDEQDK